MDARLKKMLELKKVLDKKSRVSQMAAFRLKDVDADLGLIDAVTEYNNKINDELSVLNEEIKKYQDNCEHSNTDWKGHDSHYDYYECLDCGETIKG
jgi:dissimilatory sulfite reductase (desulfoviridin) alpha/beta subunit